MHNSPTTLKINTYRWGLVSMQESIELREAEEAKAKAKVARTGKPVTLRMNLGMYDFFTTSGHYRIEKELDHATEEETGWWIVIEYLHGHGCETGNYFRTLRDAKDYLTSL